MFIPKGVHYNLMPHILGENDHDVHSLKIRILLCSLIIKIKHFMIFIPKGQASQFNPNNQGMIFYNLYSLEMHILVQYLIMSTKYFTLCIL